MFCPVIPAFHTLVPTQSHSFCSVFAGLVAPVFEFARSHHVDPQQPTGSPLRQYAACAYKGHKFKVRMLANSFWVDSPWGDDHFSFVESLLPVTDSLQPWLPSAMEQQPLDAGGILSHEQDQVSVDMHIRQFGLQKPFGDKLAVFVFPNESTSADDAEAALWHDSHAAQVCGEALSAADACCS